MPEATEPDRTRRLAATLALGFASGLPLALSSGTLTYFLSRAHVQVEAIGLFALVATPYTWKFAWAPVFDLAPPGPLRRLGRRRGWLALIQPLLAASILVAGLTDPARTPWATAAAALAIAFFSASQDVVIDGLRVESLSEKDQGWGAALTQWGYRIGMIVSGYGALRFADHTSFRTIYAWLAAAACLALVGTFLAVEPGDPGLESGASSSPRPTTSGPLFHRVAAAMREQGTRLPWAPLLTFLVVFRLGDAWAGQLTHPYLVGAGFTGEEIANATKIVGVLATSVGIGLGGALLARVSATAALPFGALIMAVSNLGYAWLTLRGHDLYSLAIAVSVENVTSGIGSAITVAFLSSLCERGRAATQYALFTALLSASRTHLSAFSGFVKVGCVGLATRLGLGDQGWALYFALTAVAGLPGIALSIVLARRLSNPSRPEDQTSSSTVSS